MNEKHRVALGIILFVTIFIGVIVCAMYVFGKEQRTEQSQKEVVDVRADDAMKLLEEVDAQMDLSDAERKKIIEIICTAYDEGCEDALLYIDAKFHDALSEGASELPHKSNM